MKLSALITAGGTREDIDAVRSIANHSTGRTGAAIADRFIRAGAEVTYVCSKTSALPELRPCEILYAESAAQLAGLFDRLLRRQAFGCVVHAMAVSDYAPRSVMTDAEMVDTLAAAIERSDGAEAAATARDALFSATVDAGKKIASDEEGLVVMLERTPKAIRMIKTLRPGTLLVGFKLLSGSDEAGLLRAGHELMKNCGCDLVVANDTTGITDSEHKALLMDKRGILRRAANKKEIAEMVYDGVMDKRAAKDWGFQEKSF